jgi:RimJ/RimL family protein N-acetyltransferase
MHTPRLELREWVEEDWQACHAYASDRLVVTFMPFGPRTEEQCKAFVADAIEHRQADPRTQFDFAAVVASTGEVIGGCDLGLRFGEG